MWKASIIAAGLAGALGFATPVGTASATVTTPVPVLSTSSSVQDVAWRGSHRYWYPGHGYNRGWGWRHRYYRHGWGHCGGWGCGGWGWGGLALTVPLGGYYGGYSGGYGSGYGGGHVEACLNRYRSYDPQSDTFMGYDGYRHRCRL